MSRYFCQECGTQAEPAAVFCASCGARLAAPPAAPVTAAPPTPPVPSSGSAPPRPAARGRHVLGLAGLAGVAALALLAGGAIVADRLAPPAGSTPPTEPAGAAGSPATAPGTAVPGDTTSPTPIAIVEPTRVPTPGPVPSFAVGETPIAAVGAFVRTQGLPFSGVWCEKADPVADAGRYCAQLVDDRGALQVVWIGPVSSEPDTWLLLAAGQYGWAVLEWAPVEGPDPTPPF